MNQVLSQSEVDLLLAAVSEGELNESAEDTHSTEPGDNEKIIRPYNLTRQDKIIRGRLPRLDVIYEEFARFFQSSLSSALRKAVSLNYGSTEFLQFGEFINTLSMPSCMNILKFNVPCGSALFVIEKRLVYAFVDNFFGGEDRPYTKIQSKGFTPIELSIVKKVVNLSVGDLQKAWSLVDTVDCSFVKTEVNPQLMGIVPSTDVVVVSTFDVDLENAHGTISLILPYSMIEPIKQKLSLGFNVEPDRVDQNIWRSAIKDQLLKTNVEVKVDLGTTSMSLEKLMNLKAGDVISLDQSTAEEFDVQVEKVKKYKAYHGIRHGAIAVQVTKPTTK